VCGNGSLWERIAPIWNPLEMKLRGNPKFGNGHLPPPLSPHRPRCARFCPKILSGTPRAAGKKKVGWNLRKAMCIWNVPSGPPGKGEPGSLPRKLVPSFVYAESILQLCISLLPGNFCPSRFGRIPPGSCQGGSWQGVLSGRSFHPRGNSTKGVRGWLQQLRQGQKTETYSLGRQNGGQSLIKLLTRPTSQEDDTYFGGQLLGGMPAFRNHIGG